MNEFKLDCGCYRRAIDNIYIERFWRSLKQEKIYLNPPNGELDLYQKIREYVRFYNYERRHTQIGDITPQEKYFNTKLKRII